MSLWNEFPDDLRQSSRQTGTTSNIHPEDYDGPTACQECHAGNYDDWSQHPHRWMNALATPETVQGDFSEQARMDYLGGTVRFSTAPDGYRMHLARDGEQRVYLVTQTIGSRFIQDYVGRLESGPEPPGHPFYHDEHVLPFAWRIATQEWVPVTNVIHERADYQRTDPFDPEPLPGDGYAVYSDACNYCHTTFPLADMFLRDADLVGFYAPQPLHWDVTSYLRENRSDLWNLVSTEGRKDSHTLEQELSNMRRQDADEHAVTLGISCEGCHLGCAKHVRDKDHKPQFFPHSPHLLTSDGPEIDFGRSHDNVNWICARCHSSRNRPYFAGGMATWNSIEYSDAMQGSCYSELTCISCHDPHEAIGTEWTRSMADDDRRCLTCHSEYESDEQRVAHTHHPVGSEGAACMSCHMPRITQGVGGIVRTHTIFSPTHPEMITANHPNACNLCHTDETIGWTLSHLDEWYGAKFDPVQIAAAYPDPDEPVGETWLKSDNEAVRLVAADALARTQKSAAIPLLLQALDDPYLINRQFAKDHIEKILGVSLAESGYRFYMLPEERSGPIEQLRAEFLPESLPAESIEKPGRLDHDR